MISAYTYQDLEHIASRRIRKIPPQGMKVGSYTYARKFSNGHWELGYWNGRYGSNMKDPSKWTWTDSSSHYPDRVEINPNVANTGWGYTKVSYAVERKGRAFFRSYGKTAIVGNGKLIFDVDPNGTVYQARWELPPLVKTWDKEAQTAMRRKRQKAEKYLKMGMKLGSLRPAADNIEHITTEEYLQLIDSMVEDDVEPPKEALEKLSRFMHSLYGARRWIRYNTTTHQHEYEEYSDEDRFEAAKRMLREQAYVIKKVYTWVPAAAPEKMPYP